MKDNFCQSCGMPLHDKALLATEKDQSLNEDYCIYCYKDGAFTQDISMDEMIDHCVQYLEEFNRDSEQKFTKEEAIAQMRQFFPSLKRWANSHSK